MIPARDAARTIGATLASLAAAGDLIDEILVIDDGSRDRTAAVARESGEALGLRLEILPVAFSNAGAARNAGIRRVRGDLLYLIDADDELLAGGLRMLADALRANPEAELVIGGYVRRIEGLADKTRLPHAYGQDLNGNADAYLTNRHRSIAMGSALVRRQAVQDPAFPETMAFDEDTVFWAAVLLRARVVTVDKPVLLYNADAARMERRFTSATRRDYEAVARELDRLGRSGAKAETIRWRKGWLATRIARALIRQGRYREAADFLSLAVAEDPRARFSGRTLWYRAKILSGLAGRSGG